MFEFRPEPGKLYVITLADGLFTHYVLACFLVEEEEYRFFAYLDDSDFLAHAYHGGSDDIEERVGRGASKDDEAIISVREVTSDVIQAFVRNWRDETPLIECLLVGLLDAETIAFIKSAIGE